MKTKRGMGRVGFGLTVGFALAGGPSAAFAGDETVSGTPDSDAITITASGAADATAQVNDEPAITLSNVQALAINAGDGNDTVTIRNPDGGLFAPENGIEIDGGGEDGGVGDVLELLGGSSEQSSYSAGADPTSGTFVHRGQFNRQIVEFTDFEPLTDTTVSAAFTINGTSGADAIVIDNGIANGDGRIRVREAVGGFESIEFSNKTAVTVNGDPSPADPGVDSVQLFPTETPTGLTDLTVDTGGDANELITPDATLPGVKLILRTANGMIEDNFFGTDITAAKVGLVGGNGIGTNGPSFIGLDIDAANVEAEATSGGIELQHNGAAPIAVGGVDPALRGLRVADSGKVALSTQTAGLTLSDVDGSESVRSGSTSGNVTLTAFGSGSDISSTVDRDSVTSPAGNVVLTAGRDLLLGTGGPNFDNDVRARGAVNFGAGRDIVVDGFSDVASDDSGGSTGANLVVSAGRLIRIDDLLGDDASLLANGTAGGDLLVSGGINQFVSVNAPVNALGSVSGDVTIDADRLTLAADAEISSAGGTTLRPVSPGWSINLGSATDAAANTLELSNTEIDRVTAASITAGGDTAGPVTVSAPIVPLGTTDLRLIGGAGFSATINGSLSETALSLTNRAAAAQQWTQSATTLTIGAGPQIGYTAANLAIQAGDGADTFNLARTPAGTTTTVRAGGGADTINVGPAGNSLDPINGALNLHGDAAADVLNVRDQSDADPHTYVVDDNSVDRNATASIGYATVESLNVSGGGAADTVNVQGTAAGTATTVGSGAGEDTINVGSPGNSLDSIAGALGVTGDAGTADTLNVRDQGDGDPHAYAVDSNSVDRDAAPSIGYATVEALSVDGGLAVDAFNVKASPLAAYSINGNGPSSCPGDTFAYDPEGRTISGDPNAGSGTISSPGVMDVAFSGMEPAALCPPSPPDPGPPADDPPPDNQFSIIGKPERSKNGRRVTLRVAVPGPGILAAVDSASEALFKPRQLSPAAAGELKLKLKLSPAGRALLEKNGKVKTTGRLTYTPTGGTPSSQDKRLKFKPKPA